METYRVVFCLQLGFIFVDWFCWFNFLGKNLHLVGCASVLQKWGHTNDSHQRQKVASEIAQEPEGFGTYGACKIK